MDIDYYKIESELLYLEYPFPSPEKLRRSFDCLLILNDDTSESYKLEEFIRLWLTEGAPYVFKEVPYLYERIRSYLAGELKIFPKNIFMIGSGKIGMSLDPQKFPSKFCLGYSDLDFTIVDMRLFDKLCEDFLAWKNDFESGKQEPKEDWEKKYWPKNAESVPDNIKRGFIDHYKIPAYPKYKTRYKFIRIILNLIRMIEIYIDHRFSDKKISFRVYKDWRSFFRQMEINLRQFK